MNPLYILIVDPSTEIIQRRAHEYITMEPHLVALQVDRQVWHAYRAGNTLHLEHLSPKQQLKWIRKVRGAK